MHFLGTAHKHAIIHTNITCSINTVWTMVCTKPTLVFHSVGFADDQYLWKCWQLRLFHMRLAILLLWCMNGRIFLWFFELLLLFFPFLYNNLPLILHIQIILSVISCLHPTTCILPELLFRHHVFVKRTILLQWWNLQGCLITIPILLMSQDCNSFIFSLVHYSNERYKVSFHRFIKLGTIIILQQTDNIPRSYTDVNQVGFTDVVLDTPLCFTPTLGWNGLPLNFGQGSI